MRISQAPTLDIVKASVLTARGDLIMRGPAVPERLAAGIMDKMLVSNGADADLTWEYNNLFHDINNLGFRAKILDIGPWNMAATPNLTIVHGLTFTNILGVIGSIYPDDLSLVHTFADYISTGTPIGDIGIRDSNATTVFLHRKTGGVFDLPFYSNAVMNRGRLLIIYLM